MFRLYIHATPCMGMFHGRIPLRRLRALGIFGDRLAAKAGALVANGRCGWIPVGVAALEVEAVRLRPPDLGAPRAS